MDKQTATSILNQENAQVVKRIFNEFVKPVTAAATPSSKKDCIVDIVDLADEYQMYAELWECARECSKSTYDFAQYTVKEVRAHFAQD